jgi:hypothetical protein
MKAQFCTPEEVKFVVIYHDVKYEPYGFETREEAEEWIEKEKKFGDYDMSLLSIHDFLNP